MHLKEVGINKRNKDIQIFWNKETNEKGWKFWLSDDRVGRKVLGQSGIQVFEKK